MSVDLAWDDGQLAIIEALRQFCRDRYGDRVARGAAEPVQAAEASEFGQFPFALWRELAELGVFATATPEGDGGPQEIAAAMTALGEAVFPGPLAATFFATQALPEKQRRAVADGQAIVSAGVPPLMPFAPHATLFIEFDPHDETRAWLARSAGGREVTPEATLGGEVWGRLELEREQRLEGVARAHRISQLALAAYLTAAGQRLVTEAAEHARTRSQFGRAIGEFQAVAHPLADCYMRLSAAAALARAAACELDERGEDAAALCAAARLSSSAAALEAAHVGHQVFGAVGITLEGPVFHISRRIRQLASQPPGPGPARSAVLEHFGLPGAEQAREANLQERPEA